jgi:N utilization substance protein A
MDHHVLVESFSEFKEVKNIDRATMMSILEDVIRGMLRKRYGTADNFDVIINIDKGDLELYRNRVIVEDGMVEDSALEIAYSEAIKIEPDFERAKEHTREIINLIYQRYEFHVYNQYQFFIGSMNMNTI